MHVLGVIPARLESQRLPHKVLRAIGGHPMIVWVYRRAHQARSLDHLLVATDSAEIFNTCDEHNIPVTMTSAAHRSGTDRIVEVMSESPAGIYVNIQGDEPMVCAEHIERLLQPFRGSPHTQVSTLKVAISPAQAGDPHNVKVVTDTRGGALYFSRSPIPYDRDGTGQVQYYKHLGLYAYSSAALRKFQSLDTTVLERHEKLEQLRFLENGIPMVVIETSHDSIGVDTEEDLRRVEEFFRQTGVRLPSD